MLAAIGCGSDSPNDGNAAGPQSNVAPPEEAKPHDPIEVDERFLETTVDWPLLWFDEERRLTHLKVIFLSPGGELTPPNPPLATFDCDDKRVLDRIETALRDESLVNAPSFTGAGGSSSLPSVEIQLSTSDDKQFKIWIDGHFLLDNPVSSRKNVFYNWTFAKILDELRAQYLGDRLKFEHFDRMSGEWNLENQKDKWRPLPAKN